MKFEFNSDGFDGLLDDLKTFELNQPVFQCFFNGTGCYLISNWCTEIAMITFFLLCNIYTPFSR